MSEGTYAASTQALADESARAEAALRDLDDAAFDRPTRCEAWDVRALAGHLIRDVERLVTYAAADPPAQPDTDAETYFTYDARAEAPRIARSTQETADRYLTNDALVEGFAGLWRAAVDVARREGPDRVVGVALEPPMALRLDEYVPTRVLEMAVHGLDLAHALGRPPWLTVQGARITIAILEGRMGGAPPASLGWDDVTYIETATGRREATDAEREVLGSSAAAFPLLA